MQEKTDKDAEISARIKQVIDFLGLTPSGFALGLGYKRAQSIYDYTSGKVKPGFEFFNLFLKSKYSQFINVAWLISGEGEMQNFDGIAKSEFNTISQAKSGNSEVDGVMDLISTLKEFTKHAAEQFQEKEVQLLQKNVTQELIEARSEHKGLIKEIYVTVKNLEGAARHLQDTTLQNIPRLKDRFELLTRKEGTEFRLLENSDRGLVITPLISKAARVMYIDMYMDADFLNEELPQHVVTMERLVIGVYRSFEHPEYIDLNEPEADARYFRIVTGRKIERFTGRAMEFLQYAEFVFVSKNGIMIAPIVGYDSRNGIFECYDGITKDVFNYDSKDILELYRVEAVTLYNQ
jgi:hypothetical protein